MKRELERIKEEKSKKGRLERKEKQITTEGEEKREGTLEGKEEGIVWV